MFDLSNIIITKDMMYKSILKSECKQLKWWKNINPVSILFYNQICGILIVLSSSNDSFTNHSGFRVIAGNNNNIHLTNDFTSARWCDVSSLDLFPGTNYFMANNFQYYNYSTHPGVDPGEHEGGGGEPLPLSHK